MSDPSAFDLLRELDPARSSEIPGPSSVVARRIRGRIDTEVGGDPRRNPVRFVAVVSVVLLLMAGTAIAATMIVERSAVLQSEGRGLQEGSERQVRSITMDDATWSVVRYTTTDGYTCVDSDLTVGGTFRGTIGGCQPGSPEEVISAGVGGVWDGESLRVLLTGSTASAVARVSATDDLGRVLIDQPVDGIWLVAPSPGASSWIVEAFDVSGNRIGRVGIQFEP